MRTKRWIMMVCVFSAACDEPGLGETSMQWREGDTSAGAAEAGDDEGAPDGDGHGHTMAGACDGTFLYSFPTHGTDKNPSLATAKLGATKNAEAAWHERARVWADLLECPQACPYVDLVPEIFQSDDTTIDVCAPCAGTPWACHQCVATTAETAEAYCVEDPVEDVEEPGPDAEPQACETLVENNKLEGEGSGLELFVNPQIPGPSGPPYALRAAGDAAVTDYRADANAWVAGLVCPPECPEKFRTTGPHAHDPECTSHPVGNYTLWSCKDSVKGVEHVTCRP